VGLFVDNAKLKKAGVNEMAGRTELKAETNLQQDINSILKGDIEKTKKEEQKKEDKNIKSSGEELSADLIKSLMSNPGLMAYLNNQNAKKFSSQPK